MKLIVGLGNPGGKYEKTRHNIGFMVIDELAARWGANVNSNKFRSIYGKTVRESERIIFLKPQTYMNNSGEAVSEALNYFKLDFSSLIIVHDDKDLDFGRMKIACKGSDGGHKGIRSAIKVLHTPEFVRVRMGIGKPEHNEEVADFVLGSFYHHQVGMLQNWIEVGCKAVEEILSSGINVAENGFNRKLWID